MAIVEWTPDLNTGIPDIDEQHQQMLHHINDFYEAANAKDKNRMSIVLFDLINSTLAHFQYEEALMEQAKYPLLEPHRRVLNSLDGWLFRHIRINDKGYTNSVNESGVYQAMHENMVAARAAQMQEYGEVAEPEPQPKPAPQPVQPKPAPRPAPQAQAAPTQPKAEPKPAPAPQNNPTPQPATQPQNKEPEDDEPRGWASGNWKF